MKKVVQILSRVARKLELLQRQQLTKRVLAGCADPKSDPGAPILFYVLHNLNVPTKWMGRIEHPIDKQTIEFGQLKSAALDSQMIALVDWANVTNAENIWEDLFENIIKPSGRKDFMFFFDLGDPSKKSNTDVDNILDLISDFSYCGSVTLCLNEKEALAIWGVLTGASSTPSIEEAGKFIHYSMNIDHLVIHPLDRTLVFTRRELIELPTRIVSAPKVSTGAGSHLKAGLMLGKLAGFTIEECMVLGMAAAGSYTQEGKSPGVTDLLHYVITWRNEIRANGNAADEQRSTLIYLPTHL